MPLYDCGDADCSECQREFGPDRSKAIANYERRETFYATLEQPAAPKRAIKTHYWAKPIPPRSFDWCAWFDGDEPDNDGSMHCGYGATKEAAIADLMQNAES